MAGRSSSYWPTQVEVFYSNTYIDPVFGGREPKSLDPSSPIYDPNADPDFDVISFGTINQSGGEIVNRWYDYPLDNLPTSPDDQTKAYYGITARYLHFRIYAPLNPSFRGLRVTVQD